MIPAPLILGLGALGLMSASRSSSPTVSDPLPIEVDDTDVEPFYASGRPVMSDEEEPLDEEFAGDPEPQDTSSPPSKVVIDMMGLGGLPPEWSGWKFIEWSGQTQGGGYSSWVPLAQQLRDSAGRILPNLLRKYGMDPSSAVVAVGFSAGSNNGLRELLRNSEDRKQIIGVLAIDGAHWNVRKVSDTPAIGDYWDWKGEADPFAQTALEAANGGRPFLATASQVARPGAALTMTREGLRSVSSWLDSQGASRGPAPAPFNGEIKATVNNREVSKSPVDSWSQGNFVVSLWPGNQPADHVWQARAIGREGLAWLRSRGVV